MGEVGLRRVEQVMGTAISLEIADPLPRAQLDEIADDVFDWLHAVDRRFSTYRPDSEVNRFDRGELTVTKCSPDLRLVINACAELWGKTNGYFDAYATGRFDPSGFVKGWAVQVASDRLVAAGSRSHWINAGGDIRARGGPGDGQPWRIGIRHPWQPDKVCWVVAGTDIAVATSGTYERGFHVVDPLRGAPARDLVSVTVIGSDLGLADAYATAGVAMGTSGLRWLAALPGHEVGVVTAEGDAFCSDGFPVVPADQDAISDQPADRPDAG